MNATHTRAEFLRLGLGLVAVAVGCGGDDSEGGGTTGTTGSTSGSTTGTTSGSSGTTVGGTGGGGSTTTAGAGGAGGGGTGGAAACAAAIVAVISNNAAGHALTVPLADIEAGLEKTYDASGAAAHCHQVTLTAADFAILKSGGAVLKFSCNGQTKHEFALQCEPGGAPPGDPDCSNDTTTGTCV